MTAPIIVVVEGGIVQGVFTHGELLNHPVVIIDYDTDGLSEEDISDVPQADGSTAEAYVRHDQVGQATLPENFLEN